MAVKLVVGPPAAGKTTHVLENMADGDLYIDRDDFRAMYDTEEEADQAFKAAESAAKDHDGDVWVIRTLADPEERRSAAERLGADEVIVLATPQGVAEERSRARGDDAEKTSAIQRWWSTYRPLDGERQITPAKGTPTRQGTKENKMEKGFPDNTPIAEMSVEEQRNYWKYQARKHEDTVKGLGNIEELKQLAEKGRSLDEDAIRRQAVADYIGENAPNMVREAFKSRAKGVPENFLNAYLEDVDVLQYLDDDLKVDTEAIESRLESFGSFSNESHGGYRQHSSASGVMAGADLYKSEKEG